MRFSIRISIHSASPSERTSSCPCRNGGVARPPRQSSTSSSLCQAGHACCTEYRACGCALATARRALRWNCNKARCAGSQGLHLKGDPCMWLDCCCPSVSITPQLSSKDGKEAPRWFLFSCQVASATGFRRAGTMPLLRTVHTPACPFSAPDASLRSNHRRLEALTNAGARQSQSPRGCVAQ